MFIIAEVGVNHNGSLELAHELIEAASETGADAVKFQTFSAEKLEPPGEARDRLKTLELDAAAHFALKEHAERENLEFISTPFDAQSLNFLVKRIGVNYIKIGSGNLDNVSLLNSAAGTWHHVLLSTGMASLDDIDKALDYFPDNNITLMHCVSSYPTKLDDANLLAINAMKGNFGLPVGLSDHSEGILVPIVATGLEITVLEKHLTLDRKMEGPDHHMSMEPGEFSKMVALVRSAQRTLGDGKKEVLPCENETMGVLNRRRAWRSAS